MNKSSHSLSIRYVNRLSIYLSVFALFLGGTIYIFFRTSEPLFFQWIQFLGLDHWLDVVRHYSLSCNFNLPAWLVYSLPNGFWAFGYAIIITSIWAGSKSWLKYIWITSIPAMVLGFELLQYPGVMPGTFCIEDLVLGSAGLIIGILIGLKPIKPFSYEKSNN